MTALRPQVGRSLSWIQPCKQPFPALGTKDLTGREVVIRGRRKRKPDSRGSGHLPELFQLVQQGG